MKDEVNAGLLFLHPSAFILELNLAQAAGHCAGGRGREVLERALARREAEARGERVADAEARARVQLVQLARERGLRDALDGAAKLRGGRFKALDEDDFRFAARA